MKTHRGWLVMSEQEEALADLGRYIRAPQRELAQLSLRRHLARAITVSDSYLSQIEHGRHQPLR